MSIANSNEGPHQPATRRTNAAGLGQRGVAHLKDFDRFSKRLDALVSLREGALEQRSRLPAVPNLLLTP